MENEQTAAPDSTAVRVALWRAMHVQFDPPPHVLEDEIGLELAAPGEGWQRRPDMDPNATRCFRASIVARARFIEDIVIDHAGRGVGQYVILGAGLDTFAQRRRDVASFGIPEWLRFVSVDFEAGESWWPRLASAGFDAGRSAIVASTGVSMYLTESAITATLRQIAMFAPGSTLVMSFLMPLEFAEPELRPALEFALKGARASGTPFVSFFTPEEMIRLARDAGFNDVRHVPAATLAERYFSGRPDGLRPPNNAEELLVATT
jgi:O-methyltransferase involved in polyketide biosynthesis